MRNWMKQLGTRLSLVVSLGVSSTALAYPPQCVDVCTCESYCDMDCYAGATFRTTCGEDGALCREVCGVGATQAALSQASLSQDAQEQQDASRDVCTEQAQPSASAES